MIQRPATPGVDDRVAREFRAELKRQDLTIAELAERAAEFTPIGTASSTVGRKLRAEQALLLADVVDWCRILRIDLAVVLQQAGLVKQRMSPEESVLADETLSVEAKQALLYQIKRERKAR